MKRFFTALLAVVLLPTSWAYNVDTDSSGIYVNTWHSGSIAMQIKMPTSPTLLDGTNYASSVQAAMQAWNNQIGVAQLTSQVIATASPAPAGTYSNGDTINQIVMDSSYDGNAFGSGVLAITLTYTSGNERVESDMVFNTSWTWDSYRGNLINGRQDIRRVAIHELGHVLGLNHPDQATPPQSVAAVMNSHASNLDGLQADDIAGGQLLYGAPGFVPANDNFASATTITLSGSSIQLTGSNVGATKQTGEPSHAGANAPNGHSVWWRWIAPGSGGTTTLTTMGSNFDSVIAVYTGSAVNALTAIVSNDDEQSGVIRTSTVSFNAIAGTTYWIAVDGWGKVSQGDQFTYTGAITLNLSFTGSLNAAPVITTQPTSVSVNLGQTAQFTAAASGTPVPTYQWQRLPAGSGTWANLTEGGSYTNTTSAALSVSNATGAMNGDQFRCVATNSVSSATTSSATLTVAVSAPTITTQPVGKTVVAGESVTFSVVATGAPTITYQWRKDGVAIAGATSSSYSLANVQEGSVATYTVVVSNSGGSVTSSPANLNIDVVPAGFDVTGYLARYPDVAAAFPGDQYGAWIYYRDYGIYQGEVFDELFRVHEYLGLYPDLAALFGTNLSAALLHWLDIGRLEGKLGRIPVEFSAAGYFARNPDVATAVNNDPLLAWSHFWAYGIYEGRAYDDEFRVFEYLAINADLTAAFVNDWRAATLHWMRYGRTEGRLGRIPLLFNVSFYLAQYPEIATSWGTYPTTVFLHYWIYGVYEGRIFDNIFRANEYLAMYPDLQAALGTDRRAAFSHWVRYGQAEGRLGRLP